MLEGAPLEERISATIAELHSAGRIKYKELVHSQPQDQDKNIQQWGHVVRVTPADVNFELIEGEEVYHLCPDKPLTSVVVENRPGTKGDTDRDDPNITAIRMGSSFYRIHMNPGPFYTGPGSNEPLVMEIRRVSLPHD